MEISLPESELFGTLESKLFDTLNALVSLSESLCDAIDKSNYINCPMGISTSEHPCIASKEYIKTAITDFWHEGSEDGRNTTKYMGVVEVDEVGIGLIDEINRTKERLESIIAKLKEKPKTLLDTENASFQEMLNDLMSKTNSSKYIRDKLRTAGFGRVSTKQITRRICTLSENLLKVGYSMSHRSKSIEIITVKEAFSQLDKVANNEEKPHILAQKEKIKKLPLDFKMAKVKNQAPFFKINYVLNVDGELERKTKKSSLPFFLPQKEIGCYQIEVSYPAISEGKKSRLSRTDKKISSDVFLPSINVYLYESQTEN